MKNYIAVNIPVAGIPEEGDKIMNEAGKCAVVIGPYDDKLEGWKKYALHLICWEFKIQKVVGLVSPGAVWVEEAMQFKEDQIEKIEDSIHFTENEGPYYYYKIKCQCGQFH